MKIASCVILSFAVIFVTVVKGNAAPQTLADSAFPKLLKLVGNWEGNKVGDPTDQHLQVQYRLTSGGSALVESLFAGTPHEMVSVYHRDNDSIAMTHYCMLGNQPMLRLKKAEGKVLEFDFVSGGNMKSAEELHMHSLTMTFLDEDHIRQEWSSFEKGQKKETTVIVLARTK